MLTRSWLVGFAMVAVGCTGTTDATTSATASASPSAAQTGFAQPSESPAPPASVAEPAQRLARDASPKERHDTCERIVRTELSICKKNKKVDGGWIAKCEAHPIWECPTVPLSQLEQCWVPRHVGPQPAKAECAGWADKLAGCDLETPVRKQCTGYIAKVLDGSPAARAGLRTGDHLLAVDGHPFSVFDGLASRVVAAAGRPVTLHIQRVETGERDIEVAGAKNQDGIYRIGVIMGNPPDCPFLPTDDDLVCKRDDK